MDEEPQDLPVPQRLRIMTVMDVYPGRARDPEHGEPIGIIHMAQAGELEQALMLSMREVRGLAVKLLSVLNKITLRDCALP